MPPVRHPLGAMVFLLLILLIAPGQASAQSIASSLSGYASTLRVASVAGVTAQSFSGVAFHPETRTLFVVDNDNQSIYELSAAGVLLRTITTTGFQDLEGIAFQGDDYFLVSEEGLGNVVRIRIPRTGSGPLAKPAGASLNLAANLANSGIEGVGYRSADKLAFAVKEIDPPRLYRIALDASGNPSAAFPDDPFSIADKAGDAADIYALNDGNFLIVNQVQDKLEGYGPQGQALGSLTLGMGKPEGLAIDTADGTLYAVGEPREFSVFKRAGSGRRDPSRGGGYSLTVTAEVYRGVPGLRFSLPDRAPVRIDFAGPDGAWTRVYEGMAEAGCHALTLGRRVPAGVGLFRFVSGPHLRIAKVVSF